MILHPDSVQSSAVLFPYRVSYTLYVAWYHYICLCYSQEMPQDALKLSIMQRGQYERSCAKKEEGESRQELLQWPSRIHGSKAAWKKFAANHRQRRNFQKAHWQNDWGDKNGQNDGTSIWIRSYGTQNAGTDGRAETTARHATSRPQESGELWQSHFIRKK